jgi:hypothetical protein
MPQESRYVQNFPEVDVGLNALMKNGPDWGEFSFDTGVLGDMLHSELTANWHLLPEQSRRVMLVVLAELYMHSSAERLSDELAAELVKQLRSR